MVSRRTYSAEFMGEAVELTRSRGVTLKQIGEELGVSPALLGPWRKALDANGSKAFPGQGYARDAGLKHSKRVTEMIFTARLQSQ